MYHPKTLLIERHSPRRVCGAFTRWKRVLQMSPAQEYAFRFASKLTLYGLCEAQTFGFISLTTMIYTHFAYIIASTAIDVKNWMNQGIDEKG